MSTRISPCMEKCEIDGMCAKCARFQRALAVKAGQPRKIYVYAVQEEYTGQYSDRTFTTCDSYAHVTTWKELLATVRQMRRDGYDVGTRLFTGRGNITFHIVKSAQPFRELEAQERT